MQRIRYLEEYSLRTGGTPDEYLKYGTGTSWGTLSLHSTDTNRNKTRNEKNHHKQPQSNGVASPTSPSNGHAFEWNELGESNKGYDTSEGSLGGGSLGGESLQGQESIRGSDKCLTEHERESARSSTLDRMGDVAF